MRLQPLGHPSDAGGRKVRHRPLETSRGSGPAQRAGGEGPLAASAGWTRSRRDKSVIRTVAGHGYQLAGEVRILAASTDAPAVPSTAEADPASAPPPTNLPEPVSEQIGRDDDLGAIRSLAAAHRLVTLTGAGGIGKTRLSLEVARHLLPRFANGVWATDDRSRDAFEICRRLDGIPLAIERTAMPRHQTPRATLDWAHRQGALSWELRAATSLARLWVVQARIDEAIALLAPVYDRFTEGLDTADVEAVKALIDDMRGDVLNRSAPR